MKTYVILIFTIISIIPALQAQGLFGIRQRPVNRFKGTQWYVGTTAGANHARAKVIESYSEFATINPTVIPEKDYRALEIQTGYSTGVSATAAFSAYVQVVLSAKYTNLTYGYQQVYHWSDLENEENQLIFSNDHSLSLGYLELPLQVRYTFPVNRFKPFVQAGMLYGRLLQAHKQLVSHSIDYASGGTVPSISNRQTADVSASYLKSQAAYTLGGGAIYNFGGLMVVAEANYRQGLHNIIDVKSRYTATRHLAGLGHVPDDIKLNALSYSVSFLFPLKFLTDKDFKPVIF